MISALKPQTPPPFEHVVRTCLAKHPDERFQSAYDVLLELKWLAAGSQIGAAPGAGRPARDASAHAISRTRNSPNDVWRFLRLRWRSYGIVIDDI